MSTPQVQAKDVVRGRRYGNRTVGNYVIDRVIRTDDERGEMAVEAHREYGQGRPTYMTFESATVRVIRNYR